LLNFFCVLTDRVDITLGHILSLPQQEQSKTLSP